MNLKSIGRWIPVLDFYISHHETYEEFENVMNSNFYNLTGDDLIEKYLELLPKAGNLMTKEKYDFAQRVLHVMEKRINQENHSELELMAIDRLDRNVNNFRTNLLQEKVAYRKQIKPNPTDHLVTWVMQPKETYKRIKESHTAKKAYKVLEFFSECGRLF